MGRFLNADDTIMLFLFQDEIISYNLYSYCDNNPVVNMDLGGYVKINVKRVGGIVDMLVLAIPTLYTISKTWRTVSKSASKLVEFGNVLISVSKKLFKKIDDRLYCAFAKESTYRFVKTIGTLAGAVVSFYSIGEIVEYIVDVLDGKWDSWLNTKRIKPKLDFSRDY